MKKTIKIKDMLDAVNGILLNSPDDWKERRIGAALVLCDMLHAAGAYKGYNNLTERDMERSASGKSFGILPYDPENRQANRHDAPNLDDSRRVYFYA